MKGLIFKCKSWLPPFPIVCCSFWLTLYCKLLSYVLSLHLAHLPVPLQLTVLRINIELNLKTCKSRMKVQIKCLSIYIYFFHVCMCVIKESQAKCFFFIFFWHFSWLLSTYKARELLMFRSSHEQIKIMQRGAENREK